MRASDSVNHAANAMLNLPGHESTAAVAVSIEVRSWEDMPSGTLYISDCARQISLELYGNKLEEFANSIHKLDTLLEIIGDARDAFFALGNDEWKDVAP